MKLRLPMRKSTTNFSLLPTLHAKSLIGKLKLVVLSIIQIINRNNAFRNPFAYRRHFLMLRVIGVKIQRRAVWIDGDQTRVKRTFEMQNVAPDRKTQNIRN